MKISGKLSSAYLAENAKSQTYDIIVVAIEVDSDTIGSHH